MICNNLRRQAFFKRRKSLKYILKIQKSVYVNKHNIYVIVLRK